MLMCFMMDSFLVIFSNISEQLFQGTFSFNSTFSEHMKSPWQKPIMINLVY